MTAGTATRARILVVEDESVVALDLRASLEHLGYEVVGTPGTGEEALRLVETGRPDLVLMDIRLRGEIDGTAAAERIWRGYRIPVVYLTAYSDDATLERAQLSEPFGYLLKPFDERELYATTQIALYRHRAQREHEALLQEQAARAALEREHWWTRFLADATVTLSASLEVQRIQQAFVRLVVPVLADWAALHVNREGDQTAAIAHAGGKEPLLRELLERHPPPRDLPHGYPYVFRTGKPDLVTHVTPDVLRALSVDADQRIVRELGLGSWLAVPLVIRGEIYGAVTLAMAESGRHFGPEDVDRVLELARRCSAAIDNARLYQLAQEAIVVREEFLSVAAHELRTPISAVLLALFGLHRLTQRPDLEPLHAKVGSILQQFDRLTALVDRLLDVSRIRTGRFELDVKEFDLAHVVREVAGRFLEPAARVGCELTVAAPPSVVGVWDQLRVEQVLTNLLGNAIKFCASKPIAVELSAEDGGICLTVRDSGSGIPEEQLPFIFERFQRGVSARSYGGLGLGLYVARQIVEAHGGRIEVESRSGEGATFRVRLPRR